LTPSVVPLARQRVAASPRLMESLVRGAAGNVPGAKLPAVKKGPLTESQERGVAKNAGLHQSVAPIAKRLVAPSPHSMESLVKSVAGNAHLPALVVPFAPQAAVQNQLSIASQVRSVAGNAHLPASVVPLAPLQGVASLLGMASSVKSARDRAATRFYGRTLTSAQLLACCRRAPSDW